MSLILEAGEKCPYSNSCQYNESNECWGSKLDRKVKFNCSHFKNGKIIEGGTRNKYDQTGNMKIIME